MNELRKVTKIYRRLYGGGNELAESKVEKKENCGRVYPLYYWSKHFHEICRLIDCEVTTITSNNLVPRTLFLTSKAREKPPGDEVAHQRQRERQKSNITLKSKSTTFHGNHALLYISSPSGFPIRKWSQAFFRHFLFLETQSVSVKKKKRLHPRVKPRPTNQIRYSKLIFPFTLTVVA